jgi:hypothetical protein
MICSFVFKRRCLINPQGREVITNHRLFRILLAFLYNFGLGGQDPSRHTYSSSRVTTGGGGGGEGGGK